MTTPFGCLVAVFSFFTVLFNFLLRSVWRLLSLLLHYRCRIVFSKRHQSLQALVFIFSLLIACQYQRCAYLESCWSDRASDESLHVAVPLLFWTYIVSAASMYPKRIATETYLLLAIVPGAVVSLKLLSAAVLRRILSRIILYSTPMNWAFQKLWSTPLSCSPLLPVVLADPCLKFIAKMAVSAIAEASMSKEI